MTQHGMHFSTKDVEAAWGLAPEEKIEKPKPEEKKKWVIPQERDACDATPPPSNRANPYHPVRAPKGADGSLTLPTTAGYGALLTVEGDMDWGTGSRTKKMLDSKQTECMIRHVLGERPRKGTPRYGHCLS